MTVGVRSSFLVKVVRNRLLRFVDKTHRLVFPYHGVGTPCDAHADYDGDGTAELCDGRSAPL